MIALIAYDRFRIPQHPEPFENTPPLRGSAPTENTVSTDPRGNHPRFMAMPEDAIAAVPPEVIGTGVIVGTPEQVTARAARVR